MGLLIGALFIVVAGGLLWSVMPPWMRVVAFMAVACLLTIRFVPSTLQHAFYVWQFNVTWILILALGYFLLARKVV
jgi:hypothetical protein